jgi:hypothetical protein
MKNLYAKLLAFQTEIGAIKKESKNPFFKSNYFDINTLIETIKPALEKHKLVILQPLTNIDGKLALNTILIDAESGEMMQSVNFISEGSKPQETGSAITYYRRYALQSFLLLEAEDDDGNSSSGKPSKEVKKAEGEDLKQKVKELCDAQDPLLKTKEDYSRFVMDKTGFELLPENYESIIFTLELN